jgi:predicted O-methyltransferase YrrM
VTAKLARLPAVARDGWRYPALRLQARTQESPIEALAALGLDGAELRKHAAAFDTLAPGLYAELATAARRASGGEGDEALRRLVHPSASSREAKKLLYLAVRALRPELVVETGTFNGAASAFLLQALDDSGGGRLLSFDVADASDALRVRLPAGCEPGWLVPERLRARFELVLGDVRATLRPRLEVESRLDLFFHDSLHSTRQMLFEYRVAWRRLRQGGLLVSDDVFWNPAFWAFTKRHRVPFRHIGSVGVTRRP